MVFLHWLAPIVQVIVWPFNLSGLVLLVGGAWFAVRAKRLFRATNTPITPSAMPVRVLIAGPYSITRNPMYLGITVALAGIAVLLGSLVTFLFPVAFFLIMNTWFVPKEEDQMEKVLGEEYAGYKRNVPRWL